MYISGSLQEVFPISTFSKMLKRLVEENGDSVSRLSQIIGIERTTLSKYISGSRLPSDEALRKLLSVIKPTEEERRQILSEFELESSGEFLYDQRRAVKEMLERLSLAGQYAAAAKLPPIDLRANLPKEPVYEFRGRPALESALLLLTTTSHTDQDRILIRASTNFPFELMDIMVRTALNFTKKVSFQHLLCFPKRMQTTEDIQKNLTALSFALPLVLNDALEYEVNYYYGKSAYQISTAMPLPYYVMSDRAMLLVSDNLEFGILVQDPVLHAVYFDRFAHLWRNSEPLLVQDENTEHAMGAFTDFEARSPKNYKIKPQPCLPRYASESMVESILSGTVGHDPVIVQQLWERFRQLQQNQDDLIIFSEEGIASFVKTAYVIDLPADVYHGVTPKERIMVLKRLRDDCLHHYRRILRRQYFKMSEEVILEICENVGAIFGIATKAGHNVAVIREDTIVKALCDFAEYLTHSDFVCSQSQTVAILDHYINELKRNL